MSHQNRLEYVKLKISVTDLGHFLGTVANLADVRGQIRAERFELEIVPSGVVAATPAQLQEIGDATAKLAENRTDLAAAVDAAKPQQ